ncbi:enoyl-CoA hydratase-related protein [Gemmatimonadota bacterium]
MHGRPQVLRDGPVRLESLEDGALWRVVLNTPKANILDMEKCGILSGIFVDAATTKPLKAVIIEAEGPHFSFGASVPEHLPDQIEAMLHGFHRLFFSILDARVVTLAAVQGQCLGGAMELAIFCNRLFASPGAVLGQPEIILGVIAPVASVMLADRVGRSRAENLLLTGGSMSAAEGLAIGLVDELAEAPGAAALEYAREHLLPKSASSLRFAVQAARAGFEDRVRKNLAEVERLFLQELINTADAQEGLNAFLEKRQAEWKDE